MLCRALRRWWHVALLSASSGDEPSRHLCKLIALDITSAAWSTSFVPLCKPLSCPQLLASCLLAALLLRCRRPKSAKHRCWDSFLLQPALLVVVAIASTGLASCRSGGGQPS